MILHRMSRTSLFSAKTCLYFAIVFTEAGDAVAVWIAQLHHHEQWAKQPLDSSSDHNGQCSVCLYVMVSVFFFLTL
jgi:hypothetical protein